MSGNNDDVFNATMKKIIQEHEMEGFPLAVRSRQWPYGYLYCKKATRPGSAAQRTMKTGCDYKIKVTLKKCGEIDVKNTGSWHNHPRSFTYERAIELDPKTGQWVEMDMDKPLSKLEGAEEMGSYAYHACNASLQAVTDDVSGDLTPCLAPEQYASGLHMGGLLFNCSISKFRLEQASHGLYKMAVEAGQENVFGNGEFSTAKSEKLDAVRVQTFKDLVARGILRRKQTAFAVSTGVRFGKGHVKTPSGCVQVVVPICPDNGHWVTLSDWAEWKCTLYLQTGHICLLGPGTTLSTAPSLDYLSIVIRVKDMEGINYTPYPVGTELTSNDFAALPGTSPESDQRTPQQMLL